MMQSRRAVGGGCLGGAPCTGPRRGWRGQVLTIAVMVTASACRPALEGGALWIPDAGVGDSGASGDGSGARPPGSCQTDRDCDDGIECTVNRCRVSDGVCEYTGNHRACDDGVLCNGTELCEPGLGCVPGVPYAGCNDFNPCTVDFCFEPLAESRLPSCEHWAMDRDGDGHVDDHCPIDPLADSVAGSDFPMGDDCDDLDDRRFPGAGEFCGDGQDNDCDGLVDGDDDDCSLANDSCLSPEELQPGMVREGRTFGAVGDVATSCGDASSPDVTYRFVVPWEADVTIDVWGQESYQPLVALQRVCGDTATEVSCGADDLAVQISRLSLSAGTYFVSVESWAEGTFQILLTLEPTQGSPQGDRCAAPLALVPGERQRLDMTGFAGDVPVACARNDTFPDAVLAFTLDEPQDVRFEVESSALFGAVAVTSQCGVPGVEAACTSGFPAVGNVCALAAGSHFLVIRGHRPGLFDIGLSLSPASDTPHNNTCGGATELLPGEGVEGSLLCSSKEVDLTCDATGRHDVVYQFEIEETRDVELTLDALDDVRPALALLRGCGAEQEERWCVSNPLGPRRIEGLAPGIYHVVVSAASPSAFTLTLDLYQASVSP